MKRVAELNPRQQTLLVFLSTDEAQKLDPVRIMKGLFLISMESPQDWLPREARYEFVAYNYGPCSFDIYSDLDQFVEHGYVKATEVPGRSWKYYSPTSKGVELSKRLVRTMHPKVVKYFEAIRNFVSKLSFRQLLEAVYHRYPQYAVKSVFKY
jgi:hypothetical protein